MSRRPQKTHSLATGTTVFATDVEREEPYRGVVIGPLKTWAGTLTLVRIDGAWRGKALPPDLWFEVAFPPEYLEARDANA